MKMKNYMKVVLNGVLGVFILSFSVYAQEKSPASRFSHKGLKAAISSASFEMIAERGLNEGEGGALSLGYGFTNRFSMWLTLLGSEHIPVNGGEWMTEFGGIELNLQQKFEIESRLQPYGKVGFGVYTLQEHNSDIAMIGAGLNVALGVDYLFSKHFGIGAEVMFKKLDYYSEWRETEQGEFFTDLNPDLNGDAVGFMLSLMIQ